MSGPMGEKRGSRRYRQEERQKPVFIWDDAPREEERVGVLVKVDTGLFTANNGPGKGLLADMELHYSDDHREIASETLPPATQYYYESLLEDLAEALATWFLESPQATKENVIEFVQGWIFAVQERLDALLAVKVENLEFNALSKHERARTAAITELLRIQSERNYRK